MSNTKQAQKDSFLLFHEVRLFFEELTEEEQGRLFMAILDYSEFGREPEFTGMLRMAFRAIQRSMDRNAQKWEQTCAKRSEAGKKSAAVKAARNAAEAVSCKAEDWETQGNKPQQRATNSTEPDPDPEYDPQYDPEYEPEHDPDPVPEPDAVPDCGAEGGAPSPRRERKERDREFELFWRAYPKKVGKEAAKRGFRQVQAPLDRLLQALEQQKRSPQWTRDQGRFIPNPATWLNQARWEDELTASPGILHLPGIVDL